MFISIIQQFMHISPMPLLNKPRTCTLLDISFLGNGTHSCIYQTWWKGSETSYHQGYIPLRTMISQVHIHAMYTNLSFISIIQMFTVHTWTNRKYRRIHPRAIWINTKQMCIQTFFGYMCSFGLQHPHIMKNSRNVHMNQYGIGTSCFESISTHQYSFVFQ